MLKSLAEQGAAWSGLTWVARRRLGSRSLVLAYHNVLPEGCPSFGDRSLHLPRAAFAAQLDAVQHRHEVVPLPDLFSRGPSSGRSRVAVTFDDAYQGALTIGLEELARRGLPATVFVSPAFIGGRSFWWDALTGPGAPGIPAELRVRLLAECRGEDGRIREWARANGMPLQKPPSPGCAATEAQLLVGARQSGITFGVHTWSHPNLTRLESSEIDRELAAPLDWLRQRSLPLVPWVSYPYGLVSPTVLARAEALGFAAGLLVEGGWLPTRLQGRYALPRYNVPAGLSLAGFELRLAGLMCS